MLNEAQLAPQRYSFFFPPAAPGILLDDDFEGAGYADTWSEAPVIGASSFLDADYATSEISPIPPGCDAHVLRADVNGADTQAFRMHFPGSADPISTIRFNVGILVESLANGTEITVFAAINDAFTAPLWGLKLIQTAGGLLKWEAEIFHNGSVNAYQYVGDVRIGRKYNHEFQWNATADTYEWRVDGITVQSGTLTGAAAGWNLGAIKAGLDQATAPGMDVFFDNVMVRSDANWPGPTEDYATSGALIWREKFQATGTDLPWSDGVVLGSGNTFDVDALSSDFGSPSDWGTQCAKMIIGATNGGALIRHQMLAADAKVFHHFEFVVDTESMGDSQAASLSVGKESHSDSDPNVDIINWSVFLIKLGGARYLTCLFGEESSHLIGVTLALDQRYTVEIKYDATAGYYAAWVDGTLMAAGVIKTTWGQGTKVLVAGCSLSSDARSLTVGIDNYLISTVAFPLLTGTVSLVKELSEALTLADALTRQIVTARLETLPLSDTVTRNTVRVLAEQLSMTDVNSRHLVRIVAESLPLVDTNTRQKIVTLTEALTLADTATKHTIRALIESLVLSDTRIVSLTRAMVESLALTDTAVKSMIRTLNEQITLAQAFQANQIKVLSEQLALADPITVKVVTKRLEETLALNDILIRITTRPITEQIALIQDFRASQIKVLTEQILAADTTSRAMTRALAETVTLVDQRQATLVRILADAIALGDTRTATTTRVLAEQVGLVASLVSTLAKILNEQVTFVDSRKATVTKVLSEAIALGDTRIANVVRVLTDAVAAVDSIVALKIFLKELTDSLALSQVGPIKITTQVLTEQVTLIDSHTRSIVKVLTDTINAVADVTKHTTRRPLTEVVVLADAISKTAGKNLNEIIGLGDTINRQLMFVRDLIEQMLLDDATRKSITRVIDETIALINSESVLAAASGRFIFVEATPSSFDLLASQATYDLLATRVRT